jgi:cobalamin-dependent methionine synthase I
MEFIRAAVYELNAVIKVPLLLLSENAEMIETVLRAYNGKAILIFPQTELAQKATISAAKKYGAVIVGKVEGITDSVSTEFQSLLGQGFSKADVLPELRVEHILL